MDTWPEEVLESLQAYRTRNGVRCAGGRVQGGRGGGACAPPLHRGAARPPPGHPRPPARLPCPAAFESGRLVDLRPPQMARNVVNFLFTGRVDGRVDRDGGGAWG